MVTTHGIDLIDKNNTGRIFLRLLKKVTHSAGADTDKHLDKLGTRAAKERHPCLAGKWLCAARSCQCRASRPSKHPLGRGRLERKLLRLVQKFDNLLQFLLGFV